MSFVSTRSDSTGKLEFSGSYNMGRGMSLKAEGFFMDADITKSHLQFELMKEFMDSHLSYKFGGGSHSLSMMQTLNSKLMGGFEMFYIVSFTEISYTTFIASHQGSSLLLRCILPTRHPSVLRSIHASCKKGDSFSWLCWQTKQETYSVHWTQGKSRGWIQWHSRWIQSQIHGRHGHWLILIINESNFSL